MRDIISLQLFFFKLFMLRVKACLFHSLELMRSMSSLMSRSIPQKFDSIFRTTTKTTKTPRVEDEERVKVERCSVNERCARVFTQI
jgi:hypothetical protein